jgi:hypothetical protein
MSCSDREGGSCSDDAFSKKTGLVASIVEGETCAIWDELMSDEGFMNEFRSVIDDEEVSQAARQLVAYANANLI